MNNTIITAIISGLCTAIPTLIAVFVSSDKNNALQDERIKSLKEEMGSYKKDLAEYGKKIEQHNNFGLQLARLETRVELLERNK